MPDLHADPDLIAVQANLDQIGAMLRDAQERILASRERLSPLNTSLIDMLRKLEWAGTEEDEDGRDCACCPVCDVRRGDAKEPVHYDSCALAALLAECDAVAPSKPAATQAAIDEVVARGRDLIVLLRSYCNDQGADACHRFELALAEINPGANPAPHIGDNDSWTGPDPVAAQTEGGQEQ